MEYGAKRRCNYGFRLLIVLGLLTGLFVSGGEGIRLFPIAHAGQSTLSTGDFSTSLQVAPNRKYQLAAHRFASSATHLTSKILKKASAGVSAVAPSAASHNPPTFRLFESTVFLPESRLRFLAGIRSVPAARGPPAS